MHISHFPLNFSPSQPFWVERKSNNRIRPKMQKPFFAFHVKKMQLKFPPLKSKYPLFFLNVLKRHNFFFSFFRNREK